MLTSFAGGDLFGGAWGTGTPSVVALHGWQRTHRDFAPVFAPASFADRHAAIAPDLPGFGATPAPPEAWGTPEYARHLLTLFDGTDGLAERITLVGHSFGGRVAVRLATMVPDRIERLVLTGVPLVDRADRRATPAPTYRIAHRLHRMGLVGDARMEAMRQRYGSPDYRAAHGVVRSVFVRTIAEEYTGDMARISCPVVLVWGGEDTEIPPEVARRAVRLFPDATLSVVPHCGHLVPLEAPDALREAVVDGDAPAPGGGE